MKEFLGIIATILVFVAYVPYVRDILKGKTKPHVYSWFIWSVLGILVAILQIKEGVGSGAYMTLAAGSVSFSVLLYAVMRPVT